jgi:cytochrome d ubiquinol oxidase subunit I
MGTLLLLLSLWYAASWLFRRDLPRSRWFLRIATCAGVAAIVAMEAGWVVTEVGRQPWIVHNYLTVEDAATANHGVWITFLSVLAVYAVLGVTTVLVLRGMSRRWRREQESDADAPYGPRRPPALDGAEKRKVPVG